MAAEATATTATTKKRGKVISISLFRCGPRSTTQREAERTRKPSNANSGLETNRGVDENKTGAEKHGQTKIM